HHYLLVAEHRPAPDLADRAHATRRRIAFAHPRRVPDDWCRPLRPRERVGQKCEHLLGRRSRERGHFVGIRGHNMTLPAHLVIRLTPSPSIPHTDSLMLTVVFAVRDRRGFEASDFA